MKRSKRLGIALLLVLFASTGCFVCPLPDSDLGSSQFITYKTADLIPAKEWTLIGEYIFRQPFKVSGATGVLNAQFFNNQMRVKTRLRYRLYDEQDVLMSQQIYRLIIKNNGLAKALAEKQLEKDIQPGYRATLEAQPSKDIAEGTLIGVSYNIKYRTDLPGE